MRDPQSKLTFTTDNVLRQLFDDLEPDHPLNTGLSEKFVSDGLLVQHNWSGYRELSSPRISFVSSPEEWCDAQLFIAAQHTLNLLENANDLHIDLKDASAWNIIFNGTQPIFCDLTSLVSLTSHTWWAADQFIRHFISPLLLSKYTGFQACDFFRISRDGVSSEVVRNTLGLTRFFSRYWILVINSKRPINHNSIHHFNSNTLTYRKQLIASLRWFLNGVKPISIKKTTWALYTNERSHYPPIAVEMKRKKVEDWLSKLKPEWTLDLGCNNGEFSKIAIESGSKVIALDGDHYAIQDMFQKNIGNLNLYPVLASLDDIHSGRGWAGNEHSGLFQRLTASADVVLMLAIIHHLCISASVHLDEIAKFVSICTKKYLIIEFIDFEDSQLISLCSQRQRDIESFNISKQRLSFSEVGFRLLNDYQIPNTNRWLSLLEKS